MDYESFYESFKYHLDKKGHGGQAMLCRHTDIPRSYLCRIHKGQRNAGPKTQKKIARYFGMGLEEFIEFGRRLTLGENPEGSTELLKDSPENHLLQRLTHSVRKEILASQQLNQAQLLYENIVENSKQIIARFDSNLELTFANRACELMAGKDRSQLIATKVTQLFNEAHRQVLIDNINQSSSYGRTFSLELTDAKSVRWFYMTVTIFPLGGGGQDTGQIVGFDITEKKKLEDQLKFIQHGVEMSYVPTLWISHKAEIVYVNNAVCSLLGYKKEELGQMHVWDINPLITQDVWQEKWAWFTAEEKVTFEGQYKTKSGKILDVEFQVSNLVYPDGRRYNVVFVKTPESLLKPDS